MKILVTGASGFIGHNVIQFLESANHMCFGVDNFTNYGFIPEKELEYLKRERKRKMRSLVHHVDIRNQKVINEMMSSFHPTTVVHLASFPRQKVVLNNPIVGSDVMMTGLVTLLEECVRNRVEKFVYVSSSMVYGDFDQDFVTEDAVCRPHGQYGIFKYAGEKLVEDYARRTGMKCTIIRPSAVYGECDVDDRVVSKFMLAAMRGETLQVRGASEVLDFTHVTDTAKGIALAAMDSNADGKIFNITRSSSHVLSLQGAAELIIDIVGRGDYEILDRDLNFPKRGRLSISHAQSELGYAPSIDVDKGLELYYNWFKESTYWQQKLSLSLA